MAVCDVIHLIVFARVFLVEKAEGAWLPMDTYQSWSSAEWTAFSTNLPLIVVMLLARLVFLGTATGVQPASAKSKRL